MPELTKAAFDAKVYLTSAGPGRSIVTRLGSRTFFKQGGAGDSVFYLQTGRAKLTVVSQNGKEATITHLSAGDFVGDESLVSEGALRKSTFTCISECTALKIERKEMVRVLREEYSFSKIFTAFLLARGVRLQADLVDQLFASSERRLASALLLMAKIGEPDESGWLSPEVTEETLAALIGIPVSSVSLFMQHFRDRGLIDYDGRIRVRNALLSTLLHDQMPGDNTAKPPIFDTLRGRSHSAKRTVVVRPIQ
jgi:CRP-like cAMP-binding protein